MNKTLQYYEQIWVQKSTNEIIKEKERLENIVVESPEKIKIPYRYIIQHQLCKFISILDNILKNRALNI